MPINLKNSYISDMKKLQQLFKDAIKARHVARAIGMDETIFYKKLKGTYNTSKETFSKDERAQIVKALQDLRAEINATIKDLKH